MSTHALPLLTYTNQHASQPPYTLLSHWVTPSVSYCVGTTHKHTYSLLLPSSLTPCIPTASLPVSSTVLATHTSTPNVAAAAQKLYALHSQTSKVGVCPDAAMSLFVPAHHLTSQ